MCLVELIKPYLRPVQALMEVAWGRKIYHTYKHTGYQDPQRAKINVLPYSCPCGIWSTAAEIAFQYGEHCKAL